MNRTLVCLPALVLLAACKPAPSPAPAEPAAAPAPAASAAPAAPAPGAVTLASQPFGTATQTGRTVVVSLSARLSEGLAWVSATRVAEAAPFVFKGLDVKPGAGPDGSDLSVFTYEASGPGSATLKFGLVPSGKMLIGPPSLVYTGPVTQTFEVPVTAQ